MGLSIHICVRLIRGYSPVSAFAYALEMIEVNCCKAFARIVHIYSSYIEPMNKDIIRLLFYNFVGIAYKKL